ncbi:MAG: Crp/Fnr family transcriptional regulator [Deltaproteobacteria bacterium]|nr:Crp/Fnr family transcriptional regulator [Deltaproteobacteria bacterium]
MVLKTILQGTVFFEGLSDALLTRMAELTKSESAGKGALLFSQGDKAEGLHVLAKGLVKLFFLEAGGKERIVHLVKEGEIFAEAAAFSAGIYPVSAAAMADSVILTIPTSVINDLIETSPDFSRALIASLSGRLMELRKIIESDAKALLPRLAGYLHSLPRSAPRIVQLPLTRAQLSLQLGMTPESFSRSMNRLKIAGLIEETKTGLVILDESRLRNLADGGLFDES